MWTDSLDRGGANYMDPWGLYRRWYEGMENMREQTMRSMGSIGGGNGTDAAAGAWQKGVDMTMENWRKSAENATEMMGMAPRWMEMLDQARENLMAVEQMPKDPLEFAVHWYNATSGPYSEFVQDIVEREEFLEQGSRFLQNYASFYKIYKRQSEEYLHNIQIPTRSDITRVASLVVALEEKVDNIEDAVEDMGDSQAASLADGKISDIEKHLGKVEKKVDKTEEKIEKRLDKLEDKLAKRSDKANDGMEKRLGDLEGKLDGISTAVDRPADTSATDGLGERMDRVEGKLDAVSTAIDQPADTSASDSLSGRMDEVESKLDQVLAALANISSNSEAPASIPANASARVSANASEIRATDAARRKAEDMNVNLAEVNGTGADGQITVEDVRKKGDA
jgi:polyhydroxyalkanoic acid synthase PhaR subunit